MLVCEIHHSPKYSGIAGVSCTTFIFLYTNILCLQMIDLNGVITYSDFYIAFYSFMCLVDLIIKYYWVPAILMIYALHCFVYTVATFYIFL